jgi:hypothetical protein
MVVQYRTMLLYIVNLRNLQAEGVTIYSQPEEFTS